MQAAIRFAAGKPIARCKPKCFGQTDLPDLSTRCHFAVGSCPLSLAADVCPKLSPKLYAIVLSAAVRLPDFFHKLSPKPYATFDTLIAKPATTHRLA